MHPDNNSHPLAEHVTQKLYKMFDHLLEPSEEKTNQEEK